MAYWMITNRNVDSANNTLGRDSADLTYWRFNAPGGSIDTLSSWTRMDGTAFQNALLALVNDPSQFPVLDHASHEAQKHITLFVHGYNSTWQDAARLYQRVADSLFSGDQGMGECILFTWPSWGSPAAYLPDRMDASDSAQSLADVLSAFYDILLTMEQAAADHPDDPAKACRAKTSMIAHSMGNYVLQKAMHIAWTRKNQPLLVSLLNQLLMVAADVDNDLFKSGETVTNSDGDGIANLTYRVTALYSGLDAVLGLSAGLKHFGKRRLGRSGLDTTYPVPDNVWDVDCTPLLPGGAMYGQSMDVHSIYFSNPAIIELMRQLLRGVDRDVLMARGLARLMPATP